MSIRVYWGDEQQTIVCYEFNGAWSWDELYFAVDQAAALQGNITHRIDVIFDMQNAGRIPANPMGNFRKVHERQPSNVVLSVFIPLRRFLVAFLGALSRFSPSAYPYYRVMDSWEEAVNLIHENRGECLPSHENTQSDSALID